MSKIVHTPFTNFDKSLHFLMGQSSEFCYLLGEGGVQYKGKDRAVALQ